jgi:hypothetical protein
METTGSPHISLRLATAADRAAVSRLAALDSAPVPFGPVLVADLGGEIVAAHSIARSRSIADPFRPTADARELLELRAQQLPPEANHPRRRHLPRIPLRRRGVGSSAVAA